MAEDKADKALRKVIVNLIPKSSLVCSGKQTLQIDISDKLDDRERYSFGGLTIEENGYEKWLNYVPREALIELKLDVENIFDAVIVNAKQRESVQRMLESAVGKYLERKEIV